MTDGHATRDHRSAGRMSPSDAVLWDIELDPILRSTITAIAVLDRSPDWHRLVHRIDVATRVVPRLRQRVAESTFGIAAPSWVVDTDFDLDYHLRRAEVCGPGTFRDLLDLVQPLSTAPFDRSRPLWEFTLVDGLEGGRAAFVQKIHHTVTDGVGGIELALSILDDRRRVRDPPMPPEPDATPTGWMDRAVGAIVDTTGSVARAAVSLPTGAARATTGAVLHPLRNAGHARDLALSIGRMVAPVPKSASPIMLGRSLRRRFDTIDLELDQLKDAAHAAGGTTNDALLAATVEGLRRYHERHGVSVEELRITMPINLRHKGEVASGNHFAPVRFAAPTGIVEPVERMRQLGAIARRWRAEPALDATDGIAAVLDLLPTAVTTAVFGAMLKHVDAVVTNVPGIPSRSYLAGAEVLREYAFAPPAGAAVNISLVSHVHTVCIGVVTDGAAVPDHDVLMECLVEGLDDVLGLVGAHARRSS